MYTLRFDVITAHREILRAIRKMTGEGKNTTSVNIANQAKCSRKTVDRHLPYLIKSDYVTVRPGAGRNPHHYRITVLGEKALDD